jgi:aspartate/glutamate racemase
MAIVGLVHTTRLVIDSLHSIVAEQCPGNEINHVMDEGILRRLSTLGTITPEIVHWLTNMVHSAETAGAELAVVSCSSLSPCVNEVRKQAKIPVLKVDEPMMEHAVLNGQRIGLVMTNPTTEAPSTLLFKEVCQRLKSSATLDARLCPEAFSRLIQGDTEGHDAEVIEAVDNLLNDVDIVMLAQISIAQVRKKMGPHTSKRVLSSLDFIAPKINALLATNQPR